MIIFSLISELIEENEENEELNEEEKHVKTVEKPLSRSQTKQNDLNKEDKKSFTCTQCGMSLTANRVLSFT